MEVDDVLNLKQCMATIDEITPKSVAIYITGVDTIKIGVGMHKT